MLDTIDWLVQVATFCSGRCCSKLSHKILKNTKKKKGSQTINKLPATRSERTFSIDHT